MSDRTRALVVVVSLAIAAACVAACGDDIRCYAPDESACGVPGPSDAASDAPADSADADAHGTDVGDADSGEGG